MASRPYDWVSTPEGPVARVRVRGNQVLANPMLNRGTAFTESEREQLGLVGLLPSHVTTMADQLQRTYGQYQRQPGDLAKNVYLGNLRARNEVLFFRLLSDHIDEMLPIVYTPTVGEAIQRFSHEYRRPRGVYLSIDRPDQVETALRNFGLGADGVDIVVATDSEGILGIGDWGVGGIEIAIGKLAVYTAAAGLHPRRAIPVVIDTGTDNESLLADEMYLGYRHPRVRDQRYDELIDAFVTAATSLFPHAMIHWEDFGVSNARRILNMYADKCCSFNDDMQGTAAVVLAAAVAAVRAAGSRLRDQTIVIYGAGTAGLGIADMMREAMVADGLTPDEATRRFYALNSKGLLTTDHVETLRDFQVPYAHATTELAGWTRTSGGPGDSYGLADVVANAHPTMLIGTSTQTGAFTEEVVRLMAAHAQRPIIMPLSNPTSRCEASPQDVIRWTDGRAFIATGSPFPPISYGGRTYRVAQANNALVFPGLGIGVAVSRARRVSDAMLVAAADAVAAMSDASVTGALLPPVDDLRAVSAAVAAAVAVAADQGGLAGRAVTDPDRQVREAMWNPEYPRIEAV